MCKSVVSEHSAMYYSNNAFIKILTFVYLQLYIQIQLNMCYAVIYFLEINPEEILRPVESLLARTS